MRDSQQFKNVSSLVIRNMAFASCGKSSSQSSPGITGIIGLYFMNVRLSGPGSESGTRHSVNSREMLFFKTS